jgi:hypothetical protein
VNVVVCALSLSLSLSLSGPSFYHQNLLP